MWHDERPAGQTFCGLANDGATCYLNSLLQALYMLPEVRQLVYAFEYAGEAVHGAPADCVPWQLARLFARLQLSKCKAVATRALTASFGWTRSDSFRQHDVQELCRVLFDCLSRFGCPIETEFSGVLRSTLRCLRCGHASSRCETFCDVQLDVAQVGDVQVALKHFVTSEALDGENAWRCEACADRVPALKETVFEALPPLLMLTLKRFQYDVATQSRGKLNHRVAFPALLDMAPYRRPIHPPDRAEHGSDEASARTEAAGDVADADPRPAHQWYECVGVLLHDGSAEGGHYTALLCASDREGGGAGGAWHLFNDEEVAVASAEALTLAQGRGEPPNATAAAAAAAAASASGVEASTAPSGHGANSYCLVYRRLAEAGDALAAPPSLTASAADPPASLAEEVRADEARAVELRAEDRAARETVHLRLIWACDTSARSPKLAMPADVEVAQVVNHASLSAPPAATALAATATAIGVAAGPPAASKDERVERVEGMQGSVIVGGLQFRVRLWEDDDGRAGSPLGPETTLRAAGLATGHVHVLLVEVRPVGVAWPPHQQDDAYIRLRRWSMRLTEELRLEEPPVESYNSDVGDALFEGKSFEGEAGAGVLDGGKREAPAAPSMGAALTAPNDESAPASASAFEEKPELGPQGAPPGSQQGAPQGARQSPQQGQPAPPGTRSKNVHFPAQLADLIPLPVTEPPSRSRAPSLSDLDPRGPSRAGGGSSGGVSERASTISWDLAADSSSGAAGCGHSGPERASTISWDLADLERDRSRAAVGAEEEEGFSGGGVSSSGGGNCGSGGGGGGSSGGGGSGGGGGSSGGGGGGLGRVLLAALLDDIGDLDARAPPSRGGGLRRGRFVIAWEPTGKAREVFRS